MNTESLLLCPFCGSNKISPDDDTEGLLHIGCDTCEAHGPRTDTYKEAAEKWNRRPKCLHAVSQYIPQENAPAKVICGHCRADITQDILKDAVIQAAIDLCMYRSSINRNANPKIDQLAKTLQALTGKALPILT